MALPDTYTSLLTTAQVGYLLRRTTLGPPPTHLTGLTGQTAAQIVTKLLADQPTPPLPISLKTNTTFTNQPFDTTNQGANEVYVKIWWANRMLNQPVSI